MFSIIFEKLSLFVFVILLGLVVASEDLKDDNIDRGSRSDKGGLWFGPRLGKRSPRYNDDNGILWLLEAAEALQQCSEMLQYRDTRSEHEAHNKNRKIIFTPIRGRSLSEDKRYESVDFTPRLGRRLADDMPATPPDQDSYRSENEQLDSRAKYFSPRLGRTMNFSPRLGRELFEVYPEKQRVARSTNKTKAT